MLSGLVLLAVAQESPIHALPIGTPGTVLVRPHQTVDSLNGKSVGLKTIVDRAKSVHYLLVGESHDHPEHHMFQASVVDALAKSGRDVIVGFEMFTRPAQPTLANWSLGWGTEDDFIKESNWKTEWGFDFALYRPVFEAVRRNRLPMVALNVPRTWVRSVAKLGKDGLTKEQLAELPPVWDFSNSAHKSVWEALMGGHAMTGASMENMYAAQVLWDTAMADSAVKAIARRPVSGNPIIVILAGVGHVMYGQGINYRITQQTGAKTVTVSTLETNEVASVSKGYGDFIYAASETKR